MVKVMTSRTPIFQAQGGYRLLKRAARCPENGDRGDHPAPAIDSGFERIEPDLAT
jgi:hypothetical protein